MYKANATAKLMDVFGFSDNVCLRSTQLQLSLWVSAAVLQWTLFKI